MEPKAPHVSFLDRYHGDVFDPLYTADVTVTGGPAAHARASGVARSSDGELDVALRLPPAMGGPGGGTNPEQLFAAGFAACFHGALKLLADRSEIAIPDAAVKARVTFGRDPVDGQFTLVAEVRIALPGLERGLAEALVRHTERLCPYAKMARQGIDCTVALEG
jgi:lipoyl-dependent peroxiredoxin